MYIPKYLDKILLLYAFSMYVCMYYVPVCIGLTLNSNNCLLIIKKIFSLKVRNSYHPINTEPPYIHTYIHCRRIVIGLFCTRMNVCVPIISSIHHFSCETSAIVSSEICMYVCRNVCMHECMLGRSTSGCDRSSDHSQMQSTVRTSYEIITCGGINQVAAMKATYMNTIPRLRLRLQSCFAFTAGEWPLRFPYPSRPHSRSSPAANPH